MVYEHLSRCFILHDPSPRFSKLLTTSIVACGDILRLVALVLGVNRLLAMAKDTGGLRPIAISKVFL
jgi:hypothetical protein